MTSSEPPPSAPPPPKRKAPTVRVPSRLAEAARAETADALKLLENLPRGFVGISRRRTARKIRSHRSFTGEAQCLVSAPLAFGAKSAGDSVDCAGRDQLLHGPGDQRLRWRMADGHSRPILGVALRFIQESKADSAAAKLKAMIKVTATVVREGQAAEVPLQCLVPGDIVKLSAGDMIPGDVRVLNAKDLFIIQATLTGESLPVEKFDTRETRDNISPLECANLCFLGTSVESGTAQAVVVETGPRTYLGGIASSMSQQLVETNFDKGIKRFTYLMLTFMMVMVPAVFFINALSKSPSVVNDDDIVNLPSLAGKLETRGDPVSAYAWQAGWTPQPRQPSQRTPGFNQQPRPLVGASGFQSERDRFRSINLRPGSFPKCYAVARNCVTPGTSRPPRFPT